jgi:hypothetical protein
MGPYEFTTSEEPMEVNNYQPVEGSTVTHVAP